MAARMAVIGLLALTAGCQIIPQPGNLPAPPETPPKTEESRLTTEMLYDILLASIAAQRDHSKIALESLSRAAYHSRDPRLIKNAIQYAMHNAEYQQAEEFAQLLHQLESENHVAVLAIAQTQFKQGEQDSALRLVVELASTRNEDEITVFHDIAALLSKQDSPAVYTDFMASSARNPDNETLMLTAALLASRMNREDEYAALLDKTLRLKSDWEVPAIFKLLVLSGQDASRMREYAISHLEANPSQDRFRLQYAQELMQHNDLNRSLIHLRAILASDPDYSAALFPIGILHLKLENLEKAEKALSRYLELHPENDQAKLYLADIAFQRKNYAEATRHLYGVYSGPYYFAAQIQLAEIISAQHGLEASLDHLQQINPANDEQATQIILEQHRHLVIHDQLERSKTTLDEGLKRYPDNPELLYKRGLLAEKLGLLALLEQDLRKLIELQPENAHAYNALGYTLADKTDRLKEALNLISKANALLPGNPFILDSMGWVHFRLGNHEIALEYLRQALAGQKDSVIAAHLGEVLWITGAREEAREVWKRGGEWGTDNTILTDTIERFSVHQESARQPAHTRPNRTFECCIASRPA
ncbi:MAG: tetratricopeptide repeat protein [Gammaproteobacteria bacterium]|nr:tetratricopeptide repeat protein [Gammaproteobacteria bacterium]